MMLSMARNIPQAHKSLTAGEWDRKRFTGTEVFEKTIGIIGLGKIGREVAQRCQGLGMKVLGYDPVIAADAASKQNIELVSLEEIYRRSDFISVHTPLSKETRGLLNDETLKRCKKGVRVINCARGGIIDEAALFRALESGHVAGAALDVFEQEPPHASPLLKHPRVVVTPHLGASTEEAQEKVAVQIAHSLTDALLGRGFSGVVNSTSMHLMLNAEVRPYVLLAEKLGSLAAQLTPGKVRRVTVGAAGDVVVSTLELLKAGILKGILSHTVPDPVNVISAPFIAKDLGLVVGEEKAGATDNFSTMVRLRYETDQETHELAGAVFGTSAIRLIAMDGFRFDVDPEGYLLIYSNVDKPGMLARVGTVLARHQVNIAGLSLGRVAVGGNALTIVNVDTDVPPPAVQELLGIDGVSNLKVVRIA
jgi:D-3-phosphoglycerate dehydrogenase